MKCFFQIEMESCLTAPWDKKVGAQKVPVLNRVLTDEEYEEARKSQIDDTYTKKFPMTERYFADPIYQNQVYCLMSFVPSKNAVPDEHGVFGFVKFRGTFFNVEEANQRAEWLVRNVDSYHAIHTAYVGRPFPICKDFKKFIQETKEVDIRKKAIETVSEDIKQKKLDEKREIDDIKEREAKLLAETKEDYVEDPFDKYVTLQVKKANLLHTYVSTLKRLQDMKSKIQATFKEIKVEDDSSPEFKKQYIGRYNEARKSVNLPTVDENKEENFLKYLADDYLEELDFDPYALCE